MTIDILYQKYIYKKTFLIITVLYTTFLSRINRLSTIINLLLLVWGIIIFIIEYVKDRKLGVERNKLTLIIFSFLSVLTIILNGSKASNLKILSLTLLQFFLLYEYRAARDEYLKLKELNKLSNGYVYVTFVTTFIALLMYGAKIDFFFLGEHYGITHYNALQGIYTGPNTAGLVGLISIILSSISMRISIKRKYFHYANIVLQIMLILLSKARGSLAGLLIYFAVYFFVNIRVRRLRRLVIIIGLLLVFLMTFIGSSLISGNNMLVKNEELGFFSGRLLIWNEAFKVIKEHSMFGVGINNAVDEVKKMTDEYLPGIEGGGMHNVYIQIAVSNGIIALLALLIFFIYVSVKMFFWLNKQKDGVQKRAVGAIFALTIALYVINIVESNLVYVANFTATTYWIYIGYGMYFVKKQCGVNNYEAC